MRLHGAKSGVWIAVILLAGCVSPSPVRLRAIENFSVSSRKAITWACASPQGFLVRVGADLLTVSSRTVVTAENAGLGLAPWCDARLVEDLTSSPDGLRIAFADKSAVRVFSWPRLELLACFATPWQASSITFSPDGARIAFHGDGMCVFDIATGRRLVHHQPRALGAGGWDIAFSADGARVVIAYFGLAVFQLPTPGEKLLEDLGGASNVGTMLSGGPGLVPGPLAVARDGRVYLGTRIGAVRVFDSILQRELPPVWALGSSVSQVVLSPDESLLLVTAADSLAVVDKRSGASRVVIPPGGEIFRIEHDGESLSVVREGIRISFMRSAHPTRTIRDRNTGWVRRVEPFGEWGQPERSGLVKWDDTKVEVLSRSGVWRAESHEDGLVVLRNGVSGEVLATIRGRESFGPRVTCLTFSPDGRELACAWSDDSIRIYSVPTERPALR